MSGSKYDIGKSLELNIKKIGKYAEDLLYYEKYLKFCVENYEFIRLETMARRINEKNGIYTLEFFERLEKEKAKEILNVEKKIESLKLKVKNCEDSISENIISIK